MGVSFSEDRGKTILSIGWEDAFKKGGYIRIIIQKRRINLNSRDIIETYFAYFKWGRETK